MNRRHITTPLALVAAGTIAIVAVDAVGTLAAGSSAVTPTDHVSALPHLLAGVALPREHATEAPAAQATTPNQAVVAQDVRNTADARLQRFYNTIKLAQVIQADQHAAAVAAAAAAAARAKQAATITASSVPVAATSTSSAAGAFGLTGFLACVAMRESHDDPTAVNPSSGAGGLFQFLPSTWANLGEPGLPEDAPVSVQIAAAERLLAEEGTSPWAGGGYSC